MVQTIAAQKVTLYDLSQSFGLERTTDKTFFREWLQPVSDTASNLSDSEQQLLDEVKPGYWHLFKYPLLEPVVKMVVLSPLLRLAGFYQPPFYVTGEQEVQISAQDNEVVVNGRLDLLVFHPDFWITLIEAKRAAFSLEAAIPQALAYMLGNPKSDQVSFGLVTNGGEFRFIKLVRSQSPRYGLSDLFAIDSRDDIYQVLKILKHLSHLALA